MKQIIPLLLVILLLVGGWFGYKELRRNRLIGSGENLVLVNKDEIRYSYSDLLIADNITREWRVIDTVSSISSEKHNEIKQRYRLYESVLAQNTNSSTPITVPNDEQIAPWQELTTRLSEAQKTRCNEITQADFSQYCYVRHIVYQAVNRGESSDICANFFTQEQIDFCLSVLSSSDQSSFSDVNKDGVLDEFEPYAPNDDDFAEL